jgi:adenine-specific DNA-methyltransferase
LSEKQQKAYKNPDNDPRGPWTSADYTATGYRPNQMYKIVTPGGKEYYPPEGVCWKNVEDVFKELVADNRIWFGVDGNSMPRRKTFLSEHEGVTPWSWWCNDEVGHNQEAKKEIVALFGSPDAFETPKPERLIQRILVIATNPGDLVLDSFLGSGTTTAVAQKMGRRWIGIEMGDHAKTHCAVRMKKVVDGEQGGISKSMKWQGGGGFRYYELGEAILKEDGSLTGDIPFEVMAAHVWFSETKTPYAGDKKSTVLGVHEGTAYVLLYNGILKDRSVNGGNVLTRKTLEVIQADLAAHEDARPPEYEKIVVYGEACRLMASTLQALKIEFRQTPYDLVTRR